MKKWALVLGIPVLAVVAAYFLFPSGSDELDQAFEEMIEREIKGEINTEEFMRLKSECVEGNSEEAEVTFKDTDQFFDHFCGCLLERMIGQGFLSDESSKELQFFGPEVDDYFQSVDGSLVNHYCYEQALTVVNE